ncbi:glycoside hydrolase family 104 protein [Leptolyngbya sp. FACHB-261]|nr:glycoside hydrolase family 104 protein [Leptolyngbya sp. FACHB-261]
MAVPQQAEAYPYGSSSDSYGTEVEELSPNTRAFLDTIAWAEGTSGRYGYQIIFTGAYFDNFVDHPRQVRCANYRRRRLCSSASGRYQFLERTWDRVSNRLNLQDFSPRSQDLAAVELIREKGALEDVEAGRWETAIYKVAPVWASLPSPSTGRSVYGQPFKSIRQLGAVYASNLNYYYQAVAREPIASRIPESYQPIRSTRWQQPRPLRPASNRLPSPVEPTLFPPSRIEISAPVAPRNQPNPRASSSAQSPPSWPSVFAENTYRTNNQSQSPIEDLR